MKREQIRETKYFQDLTDTERLVVQTCPGYNNALDRAVRNTYYENSCRDCNLTVRIEAAVKIEYVKGKCPKV